MPKLIEQPAVIEAAGTKLKRIEEHAGRVNTCHTSVSVARMQSPEGCEESGQRPEFEEISVVLNGTLRVEHEGGSWSARARRWWWCPASGFATARRSRAARST